MVSINRKGKENNKTKGHGKIHGKFPEIGEKESAQDYIQIFKKNIKNTHTLRVGGHTLGVSK